MSRRKGTPCACECDPCKGKNYIRAINNASPDPNGDFIIEEGPGIGIEEIQYGIRIANLTDPDSLVAGTNITLTQVGTQMEIAVSDDISINNLNVAGNIIQQGSSYETHAEQIYTTDDYIIMRDGAVSGLAPGDYSGFQVKLYDGTNDGRLVIDDTGTARVGDVGDEQPLLTREESADLTDGALLKWDSANSKAVDEGTVGSDTKPIKIVNGVATAITNDLVSTQGNQTINGSLTLNSNLILNNVSLGGFIEGTGNGISYITDKNSAGYQLRLVLNMQNNNIGTLVLQRLDPQGQWQAETIIATLT